MRILSVISFSLIILTSCEGPGANTNSSVVNAGSDSLAATTIKWEKQTIDFGKVPEGQKVEIVYNFTNTGNKPLVISRVEPGCGCTLAETPTEPIAPGKSGTIKGSFDSNGRPGVNHKSISVYSNAAGKNPDELVFTVEVIKKG